MGRAILNRKTVHIHDLRSVKSEFPEGYASSIQLGHRTTVAVPLLRHDDAIEVIVLRRFEVQPFTERQLAKYSMHCRVHSAPNRCK
jgi:two-component system NtrC family sensor kinase